MRGEKQQKSLRRQQGDSNLTRMQCISLNSIIRASYERANTFYVIPHEIDSLRSERLFKYFLPVCPGACKEFGLSDGGVVVVLKWNEHRALRGHGASTGGAHIVRRLLFGCHCAVLVPSKYYVKDSLH